MSRRWLLLARLPEFHLAGVVDVDGSLASAAPPGVAFHTTIEPLLGSIRAAVIAVSTECHAEVFEQLSRHGIEIDSVRDGRHAVARLAETHYSVVVLDLMIPEVNGFEVIEYMKTHRLRTPVAVVSAVSQEALTRLDLDIVKLVIAKPFDVDEFTKAIVGLCREG